MILRHLHLPGLAKYTHAAAIQHRIVSALLAHKANPVNTPPPPPTIITAEFQPVYTCGRREVGHVSADQIAFLQQPVVNLGRAEFHEALRGGQTTFHGPGQLVAYPVLDLKAHGLTPRCYVHLLESAVINTCGHYDIKAQRTANPGVWTDQEHKICALGVHLRRNVTSHGVGLNVGTDIRWFERIVACGLEGKQTTTLTLHGVDDVGVGEVGAVYVAEMKNLLQGVEATEEIDLEDIDRT